VARLALAVVLIVLSGVTAAAEHEVFYRYTVLGYVRDAAGQPVADAQVQLVRDKTGFSYLGDTDAGGFYVIVARLGDESAGERLTLRYRATTTRVVATFDPANHAEERGTRVDFDGGRALERTAWFRSTLLKTVGKEKP
jgi:hypothetical protein